MICFSVDMPTSLENVETKWIDEVRQYCPGVKVILTACKCDLREDEQVAEKLSQRSLRPTTYEEGLAVAKRIKATRYLECSAKENRGVQEAIEEGARVALGSRAHGVSGSLRQSSCCVIL
ncbi:GTP-binding protein Rho3 [Vanrija pseudolonga]|uniref:GTP-binding protein Rho3 n=1 Tax=Vanrija pseudolonga TaxID=143232 RepID=A0AAF1BTG1_9TREE|nr:GTP-binding protein Rho3 [Vanrija pseudolonga]